MVVVDVVLVLVLVIVVGVDVWTVSVDVWTVSVSKCIHYGPLSQTARFTRFNY